jgi:hypothetical protein
MPGSFSSVSVVGIDGATGSLVVDGKKTFPIVLSNGPPTASVAPSGRSGLAEVADAGVGFLRTGTGNWTPELVAGQIQNERKLLDAAGSHGLHCWTWLGKLPNLPTTPGSPNEQLLTQVVDALKGHPALGAWKGVDEPALAGTPAAGLVRGYKKVKALDPNHPLVVIQAPRGTAAALAKYTPALDITGADVYPVAYPPGTHVGGANKDVSVVGDVTRRMVTAANGKPVWTTLQIAWSGVLPPSHVPRFPTLLEERFMAYQAIVAGARGLAFFGGHLVQVMRPADATSGWNWAFWETVLRPVVAELTSTAVGPALVAPAAAATVRADASDVGLVARHSGNFFYLIAVRRGQATTRVTFSGLPAGAHNGQVLFEYADGEFRAVTATGNAFSDWFGPHDAHVYRFQL